MFNFKNRVEKKEKGGVDYMTEQKRELAKRKRAVVIGTVVTVGKAVGTAFVTGVCIQVANNTLKNEDASSSVKATAVTAAIIAGGLLTDSTYKACRAISAQGKVNKIHEGTLKLIDLVEEIQSTSDNRDNKSAIVQSLDASNASEETNLMANIIPIQISKDSPISKMSNSDDSVKLLK